MKKNKISKISTLLFALQFAILVTACNASGIANNSTPLKLDSLYIKLSNTDYSDINNWLKFGGNKSKDVDIFVVYPTVIRSENAADKPFVQLNNSRMRTGADGWLTEIEEILTSNANIYAPFYRQINATEFSAYTSDIFDNYVDSLPREDIFAAFDYYLKNVNKNRPFILFGFSQGASLVTELATTFLGHGNYFQYNKNHIITYAIGMSVLQSDIIKNSQLKFSQNKDDIGVIVSWNSTAPSELENDEYKKFLTYMPNAFVTNPIKWTTNATPALASENGASKVIVNTESTMIDNYADAIVDNERGILRVTSVNELDYESMLPNIVSKYHGGDIYFYYESIMQNIKDRIDAFKKQ